MTVAAWIYAALTAVACAFQLALAAGMPWGHLAMGGRFPGRFPPPMRVGAVVQALVLAGLALVVLSRAGVALPQWSAASTKLIWVVVAISGLSALMNLATPSKWERILWAPVGLTMLATSLVVALTAPGFDTTG